MPVISVVIPVYNAERTIRETVESALQQSFSDIEVIVIDDGSPDGSLAALADLQDPRLKLFSFANAGVSASRNRGVERARGEFIAFLDADDLWLPDKLAGQLEALRANPWAAVAYSWADRIDDQGQFAHAGIRPTASGRVLEAMSRSCFVMSGSNVLVRKEVLLAVGGFDETIRWGCEDWDLYMRLAARYEFVLVPAVHVLYRYTRGALTANFGPFEACSVAVFERVFESLPASYRPLKRKRLANFYLFLNRRAIMEARPGFRSGLQAARFLGLSLWYNPRHLRHPRFILARLGQIAGLALSRRSRF